jgi:hypothetical protein
MVHCRVQDGAVVGREGRLMPVLHSIRPVPRSALRELLGAAYADDPRNEPIAPLGEHGYTTLTRVIPSALAVLRVAARLEAEPERVMDWYRHAHIAELGHLTAEQLVSMGRAPVVIAFLQSIGRGERG